MPTSRDHHPRTYVAAGAAILLCLAASLAARQHAGSYTQADAEAGARLYGAQCSACHGADGTLVAGIDLRRGQFKLGSTDEDLVRTITRGVPGTAMPGNSFTAAELFSLVAYLRSMREFGARAVALGDPGSGQRLFEANGCQACHRIDGKGSRFAADLSDIGAVRSGEALLQALTDTSSPVAPGRRFVRAVTRDGRVITGRRLNEDTYTVQLLDDEERLVSLSKGALREYRVTKHVEKPTGKDRLSPGDRADLVAYLLGLTGVDPPTGARTR